MLEPGTVFGLPLAGAGAPAAHTRLDRGSLGRTHTTASLTARERLALWLGPDSESYRRAGLNAMLTATRSLGQHRSKSLALGGAGSGDT